MKITLDKTLCRTSLIAVALFGYLCPSITSQTPIYLDSFDIALPDTRKLTITLTKDAQNQPLHYSSQIFTQVCETGECKPINIKLYWNLLGIYQQYELTKGAILTKSDHIPFTEEDYKKFNDILKDPYNVLGDLEISDLTGSREGATVSEIDGITGATPKSITSAIVNGAVYTCHTIWHLAHRFVNDSLRSKTEELIEPTQIEYFLSHPDQDYRRWAVDQIYNRYSHEYKLVQKIVDQLPTFNLFLSKYIIQKMPRSLLQEKWIQNVIWGLYPDLPYSLQIIILNRFTNIFIIRALENQIKGFLKIANAEQRSILEKLRFQSEKE